MTVVGLRLGKSVIKKRLPLTIASVNLERFSKFSLAYFRKKIYLCTQRDVHLIQSAVLGTLQKSKIQNNRRTSTHTI